MHLAPTPSAVLAAMFAPVLKGLCVSAAVAVFSSVAPSFAQADPASFSDKLRPRVWIGDGQERYSLEERMAAYSVPGVAVAIIENGEVVFASGYGVRKSGVTERVDADTVFSAGSVSKVATASLILRLASAGALDLDAPVAAQLHSWSLPDYPAFDENRITLRTILSHTSGFNMHGFRDFQPGDDLPSTIETLEGRSPAVNAPLTLLSEPGSAYRYSGGGYTLAQQIVDDVDPAADFDAIAYTHLLVPLGMTRSTFTNPLPQDHGNIAMAHDRSGAPVALPRGYEAFPESAASGLWTSANDLATLVTALLASYQDDDGFLPRSLAQDMMTPVSPSEHGLGPRIEGRDEVLLFHHGGTNSSYHAWIEGYLATGDGLVILTNGSGANGLITEIRNAVSDAMNWEINQPVRAPEITLSADQLSDYTGTYRVDVAYPYGLRRIMVRGLFEQRIHIESDGARLTLTVDGNDGAIALIPLSPNRFWIEGFGLRLGIAELEFHRDAFGETHAITFHLPNASSHYLRD